MKKFTLTLTSNSHGFEPIAVETIESDHILELLSMFPRVVAKIQSREVAFLKAQLTEMKWRQPNDDDIPF